MATGASPATISANRLIQFGVAFLAIAVALLIRGALTSLLGDSVPYVMLFPAVAFTAWYCGVGPSVVAVVLALAGAKYWFIPPLHSLSLLNRAHAIGMFAFLLASGFVVALGEARRRENERLRRSQRMLEDRVKERTPRLTTMNLIVLMQKSR